LGGRKGIRPVKTEWWGAGVVIYLEQGADLHTAKLMPLPLTQYRLTRVVLDKGPFKWVYVCKTKITVNASLLVQNISS